MAEYLELVQTILEEKERATWSATWSPDTTIFLLNEVQCKHLWCTIRAVYNYLSSSQLPAPHNKRHKYLPNIFREFYVLVTRANAIEHQFGSRHSWLQAAILQGDHQLAFKELIENLQACVRIFANITNHVVPLDASTRIWRQDVDMKGDGQRDAENLRNRLEELLARPPIDEHEMNRDEKESDLEEHLFEDSWNRRSSSTSRTDDEDVDSPQMDAKLKKKIEALKKVQDLCTGSPLRGEERLLAQYVIDRERNASACDISQDENLPEFYTVASGYPTSILEHIGHGASGSVYAVRWLGILCAKKHFSATEHKDFMKEFMKEVNVMAKLNHPHIVELLCASVTPEVSFVMKMMPMTLFDFIKERWNKPEGIVPPAAIDIMLQIAQGMEYLHEQDIVHRDLKSSNILVAPSQVRKLRDLGYADVKLTDFGLAKMKVVGLTKPTRKMMGTTKWMAPEAYTADEGIDWKKADAYSFAMTCSEILTGLTPFSPGLLSTLFDRIMRRERPKLPSSCPKGLVSVLQDCWDTEPSVRPSFTKIRETLTSIKAEILEFQWNDRYARKIFKKLEGRKYVAKRLQSTDLGFRPVSRLRSLNTCLNRSLARQ